MEKGNPVVTTDGGDVVWYTAPDSTGIPVLSTPFLIGMDRYPVVDGVGVACCDTAHTFGTIDAQSGEIKPLVIRQRIQYGLDGIRVLTYIPKY